MALKVGTRGRIASFIVMDVLRAANERQAAGAEVLHLEIGQPGTPAPAAVRAAAKRAIDEEPIGYTDAFGLPALRGRIARHYAERYGVEVDPARVAVTPGSSGGFLLAFLAAFDPGDRVALAAPGYPAYRNILTALDLEPVLLGTGPAERYQPTPELLERAQRERPLAGVIVASPSNPTGTMLGAAEMAALSGWCRDAGVRLISDEIYHGIGYGSRPVCALEQDAEAIVVNSFSKYYSMTGWRLGWLVLPEALVRPVECLGQNLFISAHAVSQHAGIVAFDCTDELDGYVAGYARNRALLLDRLPAAGLDRLAPADGAFYLYADVGHLTNDSQAFCRRLLDETGIAIAPGVDFDPERGHRTVRLSFAGPERDMALAAERLADWLKRAG
ncbi:Aspartate/methionine/tyrosine aminotransferase [Tistlia consotensis]|uniref:Aminotransferase n=1 Tax=Tistlia consotensis USBA 355 TaxID=560819 RepID=A0A1Y6CQ43_9PROT|nr:aminotransferase class I/II-fold pyridoxal phosphate-dependent enzyme [Tistlia consotensis]SMF67255.1 Aspartate/methionine/tyrosine aminotransferase [Tistlia consotensis USBA 355]SNS00175.1 Aspartate/methionine/tyrosine aminotransferase [Tistlia consotensis]